MKYAYILGSNAFVSPQGYISFTEDGQTKQFLSIRSIYHDTAAGSHLSVDLDIRDMLDRELRLNENQPGADNVFKIITDRDRVRVTDHMDNTIIDVHQLDDKTAMALEHNIIAELEVNSPIAVIRIRGNFMLGNLHIEIDNEKLFINGNSYANSVIAGADNLQFATEGVVI
jgi:hypothetical protein